MKYDYVVIDFEYADSRQFACQLGIVPVLNGVIVDKIEYLIQPPENKYGFYETKVHGITPEMTKFSPTFEDVWDEIEMYFDMQTIVCHGAATDVNVLQKTLKHYGLQYPTIGVIDTLDKIGKKPLEHLALAYGVEYINQHNALSDALALAEIYIKHKNGHKADLSVANEPKEKPKRTDMFEGKKIKPELLIKNLDVENKDNPFYNKSIVITGTFFIERNIIASIFKKLGADINTSISKKTNFVLAGDDAGPAKLLKIAQLNKEGCGIKLLMSNELEDIIENKFDSIIKK